ncbi:cell number regulator 2-like isoform X2 [Cucurbita maxima]|uniref:Cell number regulator 2-like isoform X2 n=1 Tax=Cucurbita maxima TaxID=3661 RepID=A0A6J1KIC9_CUCMA|nr:cell number regulator 2-like isoform X2 [Cucurbita maxima]
MSGGTPMNAANGTPWSTGLCDCFDDLGSCCCTFWCPCVPFGQAAEIIDEGSNSCLCQASIFTVISCFTPCICLYTCYYRSRLRAKYQLQQTPCNDCCVHFWCLGCAMCQEYRELKNRGFDMHIGWQGNMQKQNNGIEIPPIIEGQMKR